MRTIGMDVRRSFAQIATIEDGLCRDEGWIGVRPEDLRAWAATLDPADQVALEATTNSDAIATLLRPLVAKVVVSNPRKTRAIAEAKVKTDKVDARILAQLLAADFLPETWVADDRTRKLRRLIMRRDHLVRQRTRRKNQVHAILSRNLVPTCPHADLFPVSVASGWPAKRFPSMNNAVSTRSYANSIFTAKNLRPLSTTLRLSRSMILSSEG